MIFTFYSYKGGVGRSMALATVSRILAGRGLRVLAVDFDLEAPGLEYYFYDSAGSLEPRKRRGLMDLIQAYRAALSDEAAFQRAEFRDLTQFVADARSEVGTLGGYVRLMTAGQREPLAKERDYTFQVRSFDWQDFYFNWKGDRFFDWLRRQWADRERGYDVVLVDSRTGISEMGGVCAYQLADAAILLCAPNYQNLRGTATVARDFSSDSVTALRSGRPLQILAVPARLAHDHPRREQFLKDFDRELGPLGLPARFAELGIGYQDLALPYLPEFAVAELQVGSYLEDKALLRPEFQPFARLADALTLLAEPSDPLARFRDEALARFRGEQATAFTPLQADTSQSSAGYDIFLDCGDLDRALGGEIVKRLAAAGATVFLDSQTLPPDMRWTEAIERALDYSAGLVVCFGASGSSAYREELLKRARQRTRLPIVPLLLPGADPTALRSFGLDGVVPLDSRQGITEGTIADLLAVLRRPAASGEPADAAADAPCPYAGPRAYTEDEAPRFFGREKEVERLLGAIRTHHVILLEGPALVGKSSLVAAGLLPRLRARSAATHGWSVNRIAWLDARTETIAAPFEGRSVNRLAHLDPSRAPRTPTIVAPFRTGAPEALPTAERPDVVVVDRLDECAGTSAWETRLKGVNTLVAAAGPDLKVLLIWRGALTTSHYEAAIEEWRDVTPLEHVLVESLHGEALRDAIEKPAKLAGHLLENGLLERLVEGAGPARSGIFQIQLTLVELWAHRRRGWMGNRALDALDHLAGVFQRYVVDAAKTTAFDRTAAQTTLIALTEINSSGEAVPRPLAWEAVATLTAVAHGDPLDFRDRLAGAGLIDLWRGSPASGEVGVGTPPPGSVAVRIALARSDVATYYTALDATVDVPFLTWRTGLSTQLKAWQIAGRSTDTLLTEKALGDAEQMLATHDQILFAYEHEYIAASLAARAARTTELKVTIVHGDLRFVAAPLLIGHYESARLTGTEALVNGHIGGGLTAALEQGLYPGPAGSHQVFQNSHVDPTNPWRGTRPPAVIVVGLGREGHLAASHLQVAIRQAVIAWAERQRQTDLTVTAFELAATLIGSGGQGISVATAAEALAEGIQQANALLAERKWPCVERLTVVELYMDRATDVWRALQLRTLAHPQRLALEGSVVPGRGGLARTLLPNYRGTDHDLISARVERSEDSLAIAFRLSSAQARSDLTVQSVISPRLIDSLMTAASNLPMDLKTGQTLSRFLLPPTVEQFVSTSTTKVIDLDHEAAAFPWELLPVITPASERKPWSFRLVRRIGSSPTLRMSGAPSGVAALVVGDPATRFHGALTGARREARSVADALRSAVEVDVDLLIGDGDAGEGPDARTVVGALFQRAWQIVHLTGHPGEDGGLALSNETALGPSEIQSLAEIPQLVFLSTCHPGGAEDPPLRHNRARAATVVAEQLLATGVRAVVVAAWVVAPEPAQVFAGTFYRVLLSGSRLADAVAAARESAYENNESLTWGAFQCYGDPDWILRTRSFTDAPPAQPALQYFAMATPSDLVLALDTAMVHAEYGRMPVAQLRLTLESLEDRHAKSWGDLGQVAEGFGRAWAMAGDLDRAITWYDRARSASDGQASIRASEQVERLRARVALARVAVARSERDKCRAELTGHGKKKARASSAAARQLAARELTLKQALKESQRALERAVRAVSSALEANPTLELSNLLGSTYRRLAVVEGLAGQVSREEKALQGMRNAFTQAETIARAAHGRDAHLPAMNRLAATLALNAGRDAFTLNPESVELARRSLKETNAVDPDFWSVAAETELDLFEAIAAGKLASARPKLQRQYGDLHARVNMSWMWASLHDGADFVLSKYTQHTPREKESQAARSILKLLAQFAEATTASSQPSL